VSNTPDNLVESWVFGDRDSECRKLLVGELYAQDCPTFQAEDRSLVATSFKIESLTQKSLGLAGAACLWKHQANVGSCGSGFRQAAFDELDNGRLSP
jgi:hypothetical protein